MPSAGDQDQGRALSLVFRLTRAGQDRDAVGAETPAVWQLAAALAERERLAPLCWARSRPLIEALAPAPVAAAWRAQALAAAARGAANARVLADVLGALRSVGVEPVVLKGLPLSQRLYADPALRPSGDLDLFVEPALRERAESVLEASGWRRSFGVAPREAAFRRSAQDGGGVLEIHSRLADDNLLEHLRLPGPGWRLVEVSGLTVRAHDDAWVAACIALHLVKRFAPPLLWVVDLATLWAQLDEAARARARDAAARHRLGRCLARALGQVSALDAAAAGDSAALAKLGYGRDGRRDPHNAVRVAAVSDTLLDAARVVLAWAWPHELRSTPTRYARTAADRLRRVLARSRRRRSIADAVTEGAPPQGLAVPALHTAVRELLAPGVPVWIRATGTSMRPAIEPGMRVRLLDPADRPLRRGDVVLARLPTGRTVLHRVRWCGEERVVLRGDNALGADPAVDRSDILAVADLVEDDRGVRAVPRRLRPTWRSVSGDARRLARRVITFAGTRR